MVVSQVKQLHCIVFEVFEQLARSSELAPLTNGAMLTPSACIDGWSVPAFTLHPRGSTTGRRCSSVYAQKSTRLAGRSWFWMW